MARTPATHITSRQTVVINSYPERIRAMEWDLQKAKFVVYACISIGLIIIAINLFNGRITSDGYIIIAFGITMRVYTHLTMYKKLIQLRKDAEIANVVES